MITDLESAIKHCEEVTEDYERCLKVYENMDEDRPLFKEEENECKEYASEHRQLVEWLKKLLAYEEAEEEIKRKLCSGQWSDAVAYGMSKACVIIKNVVGR